VLVVLLILLLIAAVTGVLGAVLEVTLVIVLSLILSVVLLVWIGSWWARRRFGELQRELDIRVERERRRRTAYDVGPERRDGTPEQLGDGR
jgi:membrane protein implicated in regulation of membrane protease activity